MMMPCNHPKCYCRYGSQTLFDIESSVDIIFKDALDQLTLKSIKVTLNNTHIVGFISKIVIEKRTMLVYMAI